MTIKDFEICGFGSTQSQNLHENMSQTLDNPPLYKLFAGVASQYFRNKNKETESIKLGTERFKDITKAFPNILELKINEHLEKELREIKGLSKEAVEIFLQGLPKFKKFLSNSNIKITKQSQNIPSKISHTHQFTNKIFVFSGFRNDEWQKIISLADKYELIYPELK